jgi:hypothetical protein
MSGNFPGVSSLGGLRKSSRRVYDKGMTNTQTPTRTAHDLALAADHFLALAKIAPDYATQVAYRTEAQRCLRLAMARIA